MSKRRLDKLEDSLSPKESVIHWLTEAHTYGSLPAYVESLIDQPEAVQPFIALPAQVEKAVFESMRGQRSGFIKEVAREAIGDTVFLLRLVIGLNVHIEEILQTEGLRHTALVWWSRALESASKAGGATDDGSRSGWRRGVVTLHGALLGTERARAAAEARYLDGHDCLFPELASEWRDLCAAAELLANEEPGPGAEPAMRLAERPVERVAMMARADGLEASGRAVAADAMAVRVVRLGAETPAEGADG
jgi:hypothetical protein